MTDTPYSLGRVEHPEVPEARRLYPARALTSSKTYRYWYEGGAWLDQGPTGTCVYNAFCHRRADSPVPHSGVTEELAQRLYVDGTGDTSLQEGTNGIVAARHFKALGWITGYTWPEDPAALRYAALEQGAIAIGIAWYWAMFDGEDQYDNYYLDVDKSSGVAGGHEVLINGINLKPAAGPPFYRIKNSWGQSWGHKGTARVPCDALEDLIFNEWGDACLIQEV